MKIVNHRSLPQLLPLMAALGAGLALAACTTSPTAPSHATAQDLLGLNHMQDASGIGKRDLTPEEKAVVSHAVGLSVSNPNSAQFKWPQIANTEDGAINYLSLIHIYIRAHRGKPIPSVHGFHFVNALGANQILASVRRPLLRVSTTLWNRVGEMHMPDVAAKSAKTSAKTAGRRKPILSIRARLIVCLLYTSRCV